MERNEACGVCSRAMPESLFEMRSKHLLVPGCLPHGFRINAAVLGEERNNPIHLGFIQYFPFGSRLFQEQLNHRHGYVRLGLRQREHECLSVHGAQLTGDTFVALYPHFRTIV